MTNAFKDLKSSDEVPESLKQRVMQSVNIAGAVVEIVELFTINYADTLGKLFITKSGLESTQNDIKEMATNRSDSPDTEKLNDKNIQS